MKKNMRVSDGRVGARTERENKERDILLEGAITGFGENMALRKFPEIYKVDPS